MNERLIKEQYSLEYVSKVDWSSEEGSFEDEIGNRLTYKRMVSSKCEYCSDESIYDIYWFDESEWNTNQPVSSSAYVCDKHYQNIKLYSTYKKLIK